MWSWHRQAPLPARRAPALGRGTGSLPLAEPSNFPTRQHAWVWEAQSGKGQPSLVVQKAGKTRTSARRPAPVHYRTSQPAIASDPLLLAASGGTCSQGTARGSPPPSHLLSCLLVCFLNRKWAGADRAGQAGLLAAQPVKVCTTCAVQAVHLTRQLRLDCRSGYYFLVEVRWHPYGHPVGQEAPAKLDGLGLSWCTC